MTPPPPAPRLRDITLTFVDFEGTGTVDGLPDEPWQLGLVRLRAGRVDATGAFCTLLRVRADRPFNRHAPGRHAEQRAAIAAAPRLPDLWPTLRPWLAAGPLGAHQAATEKRYLKSAFPLHPLGPWVDTLKLARYARPALASYTLDDLTAALGLAPRVRALAPGRAPHDALYDAFAGAVLLEHLLEQPGWENTTLAALVAARPPARRRVPTPGATRR